MNNVDYDPNKFYKDAYGNLIPKGKPDTCRAPKHVIDSVEQDKEIMAEYGLDDECECDGPMKCAKHDILQKAKQDDPDRVVMNGFAIATKEETIHRPHKTR
jgi:hypothetical protein